MLRSQWLVLTALVLAFGCSEDTPTKPDLTGQYEVVAALWLFDGRPSVVAQVTRTDPTAPPATSAVVRANDVPVPPGVEPGDGNRASFELDLPTHTAGDVYVVTVEVEGTRAECTLASPAPPCEVSLIAPAAGSVYHPDEPLSVEWSRTGTPPGEFEINVHRCPEAPGDLAYSRVVTPETTTHEIPAAVTVDVARCDSIPVELIARDVLPMGGSLPGAGSAAYIVHSKASAVVPRSEVCTFTGITVTDESGIVSSTDPGDWCVPQIEKLRSFGHAYPNPSASVVTIPFRLYDSGPVSIWVADGTCAPVRVLQNGQLSGGRHEIVWDGRDDAGVRLPAGIYRCYLVAGDFVCHGDIELQ